MSAPRKILVLLLAAGAYLAADLGVLHGPVHRLIQRGQSPVVAEVGKTLISQAQLDRAVQMHLWREGKSAASSEEQAALRPQVLDELIDQELVRQEAAKQAAQVPVSEAEVDEAVRRFALRFPSRDELAQAARNQGLTENELRGRIAASLQQEKFLARQIASACEVSDAELAGFYEKHRSKFVSPERCHARQVFLATLNREPDEARDKLTKALEELTAKKATFEQLASTLSEDERSKARGGDLGWFTREHLPADFAFPVFSLPVNKPGLVRTKIGWHLIEVLAHEKETPRPMESVREELREALSFEKRETAIKGYLQSLRQKHAAEIRLH